MPGRQTRRQSAKARDARSSSPEDSQVVMNGHSNGSAGRYAPEVSDDETTENIFLFWPNIIGKLVVGVSRVMALLTL